MLSDIEVLDHADENFRMRTACRIPDTPGADVKPGAKGFPTVPISRMVPRSFITNLRSGITNLRSGDTVRAGAPTPLRGIAFGGDAGVGRVEVSGGGGRSWTAATLGRDEGAYSFRQWQATLTLPGKGPRALMVRCAKADGLAQPAEPRWNPGGYMRNVIESTQVIAA